MQMTAHGKDRRLLMRKSKLTLLLAAFMLLSATAFSQTLQLNVKNMPLEKAFREIESKVPQRFVYTRDMLAQSQPVTVNVRDVSLQKILELVFQNQPLEFSVNEKFVIVRLKSVSLISNKTENRIQGKVLNERGEAMSGVTISVKGKTQSVATDMEGNFSIENISENALLEVSNVGYAKQVINIKGQSQITIKLDLVVTTLDETIIVAYGTTTRRLNTGTVSKVSAKEIAQQPVSNPIAALQGRVPGLFITQQNGLPGSNFSVLIRGRNSIQNGTSPLFIIDGVPFLNDADRLTQRGGSLNANNPFNSINPLDIESMEVLKDADATAIYGSRGANGVILITTKKARSGKTTVDANFLSGWGNVTRTMQYMNTPEYLAMRREAFRNDNVTPTQANAYDLLSWDTTRQTDWKKLLIGGTARVSNASLRLSGGGIQTNFTFSTQYYRETTVFPSDNALERATTALNFQHQAIDKKFDVSFSTTFAHQKSSLPQTDLTQYITLAPNAPTLYDSLGRLNWRENNGSFTNPLATLFNEHNGTTQRLTSNLTASYRFAKKFRFKISLGYNSIFFDETTLRPIASQDPASNPKGSASFGTNKVNTWIIEPQLEYNTLFGRKGELSVLAGITGQESINKSSLIEGNGYVDDALLKSVQGAASTISTNGYGQYRYEAVYSRINLRWDRRFLLNLTARRDGSSRFGADRRFANFGAIGVGWIFSNESFINNKISFLSYGKVRMSFGVTGNDQIGDYKYLDIYTPTTFTYQGLPSLRPMQLFNAEYSWERNKKFETAIELGFWKDNLLINLNWFRNNSDNQLISYNIPAQTGFNNVTRNFPGEVLNYGYEIEATGNIIKNNNVRWTSSINLTIARNKLLSFPDLASSSYVSTYAVGQPLNLFFGYQYKGVDPQIGVYVFEDKNRDGVITAQNGNNFNDYVLLGTTDPDYYGGFQNEVSYGKFKLNFLFQFVKQLGRHPVYSNSTLYGAINANLPVYVLNHWAAPGDIAPYQKYSQKTTSNPAATANRQMATSSAALTDASFARLKNVELQYTLPSAWMNRLKLSDAKIYLQAQNLFTLTSFEGADPEAGARQSLPPLRMVAAGINLKF
jgi:TonB-linked SusC/RagA family outer membrane protein